MHVDILLIGGLWLHPSAWDAVVPELKMMGHRAVSIDLPAGVTATLDDQIAAVLAAVDAADRPLVVGHSAASTLAWLAADRRPSQVKHVALIGGFPSADGETYAGFFPVIDGAMPFPGWEPFEGPDAADLDAEARRRFEAVAVTVPAGVSRSVVRLKDPARFEVPVTVICPEFSPEEARAAIDGGDAPELAKARTVELVDLDSGHWPMFTRPAELARILAALG